MVIIHLHRGIQRKPWQLVIMLRENKSDQEDKYCLFSFLLCPRFKKEEWQGRRKGTVWEEVRHQWEWTREGNGRWMYILCAHIEMSWQSYSFIFIDEFCYLKLSHKCLMLSDYPPTLSSETNYLAFGSRVSCRPGLSWTPDLLDLTS